MNPEAEQPVPVPPEQDMPEQDIPTAGAAAAAGPAVAGEKAVSRRRAGVPVWRTGKPDAYLAAAVDTARAAVEGITAASSIGRHLAAKSEGDRLVTHLFECRLPGYLGWQWYAVLTRNSRSKVVTVNELGLLPSEDSILAPDWVPWAERVRPEDEQDPDLVQEPTQAPDQGREPEQGQELEQGQESGSEAPDDDGQPDDDEQPDDEARTS